MTSALRAARLEARREQVAEIAVGAVGRDRRDDDVAGPDLLGGDVQHPVVAGMQQHGHCGARRLRAGVDRTHVRLHQAPCAPSPRARSRCRRRPASPRRRRRRAGCCDRRLRARTWSTSFRFQRGVEARIDAPRVAFVDLVPLLRDRCARPRCSAWCRRSSDPVSGSMPRTAPIISLANRMLSTGITRVSRSMPGW